MAEKDINGMRAQNWTAKDTSLTEKARDNNKSKVTDSKLSKLYEALTEVIITSVKDSYGKNSDKKYIYQTDMLMSRVRKALTEKLSDLQIDSIKQLVIDNAKQQDILLSKMLLNAFSTLSVKIDKNAQAKLVEKIAVVVNKLLKSYVAKNQSSKSNSNDTLTEIVSALKSSSKSQATHKAKEAEIKQYQSKAYKLISKTLDAVNQNHAIVIQSMTAGFKHTTETISNEVSSLQENIEDANSGSSIMSLIPQLKNASAIAKFANPMSWFKSFVMNPMKLLFSGLWNFLLKPMFYVGKFLLKPIGYLVKGIWDNFIKKPIAKLIELTGNVLGAVTSAATTALSVFFLTPKGAYILGYAVGYVWSRWIKPIAMPMLDFLKDKVLPIAEDIAKWSFDTIISVMERVGKPLLEWIKGESSFNDAIKKVIFGDDIYEKDTKGNVLKDKDGKNITKTWSELIKTTFNNILENHPTISKLINFTVEHPLITAIGAYLGITAIANPWQTLWAGIKVLQMATEHPAIAAAVTAGITAYYVGKNIANNGEKITDEADSELNNYFAEASQKLKEDLKEIEGYSDDEKLSQYKHIMKNFKQVKNEFDELKKRENELLKEVEEDANSPIYNAIFKNEWSWDTHKRLNEARKQIIDLQNAQVLLAQSYGLTTNQLAGKKQKKILTIVAEKMQNVLDKSGKKSPYTFTDLSQFQDQIYLVPVVPVETSTSAPVAKTPIVEEKAEELKLPVEVSTSTPNTIQTQQSIEKTIDNLLMPLGTAAYIVNAYNNELEKVKSNLLKEESAKQISQLARDASKKAAEQSAQLTAKEYKNVLDAALGAYDLKTTKSSLADNMKLNQTMLKDVSDNQEEFLKRMDKLQTTLEQMFISKGKSQDEAKQASYFFINNFKDTYAPMRNKDRYTTDYITSGDY